MPRIEHRFTRRWQRGGDAASISRTVTIDGDIEIAIGDSELINTGTYRKPYNVSISAALLRSFYLDANQPLTLHINGTDALKRVTRTGTVSGGTFTITFTNPITTASASTAAIAHNATIATIQAAINAMTNVDAAAGEVTVSGTGMPTGPFDLAFAGRFAAAPITASVNGASLTGGGSIAIADQVVGVVPSQTIPLIGGVPLEWARDGYESIFANPFTGTVNRILITNLSGTAATPRFRFLSNAA